MSVINFIRVNITFGVLTFQFTSIDHLSNFNCIDQTGFNRLKLAVLPRGGFDRPTLGDSLIVTYAIYLPFNMFISGVFHAPVPHNVQASCLFG